MARKSLGTLTLDLIAKVSGFEQGMDKASRKSQKTAKKIERHANQIGTALAAGTTAAVAGMAALVASTAEGARQIENLSTLAGSSPQEFQRLTYAAKRFGIEQDRVSDILKDTNDRIGDFIQTGGGPMADFFENIAPKVGVTADEFARLSGPDALQLYVKSLEDAGVSQKDMTFYMEALASDATTLVPLLADNGKKLKALGDEAERTGNVFSDMEFEQLESVRRGMDELTGAATGMKNEIVLAALPAIEDLVDMLSDESTVESAKALGNAIVTSVSAAVAMIDGAVKVAKFLGEELAAAIHGAAFGDLPRMQEEIDKARQEMSKLIDEYNRPRLLRGNPFISTEDLGAEVEAARDHLHSLEAAYNAAAEAQANALGGSGDTGGGNNADRNSGGGRGTNTPGTPGSRGISSTGKAARDAAEAVAELEKSLAEMRAELDPAMAEFDRYANQIDQIEQFNITAAEKEKLREAAFAEHQNRMIDIAGESRQEMFEQEASYWEQWMAAAENNLQNFDELSKTVIDNFATGFGNAFESVIFDAESLDDAFKGIAETILRSVVNAIGQMAAQWLALQAVQAVVGTSATAATVGQAAVASAAWATPAALASLATVGSNAVPASAAIVSTTSLAKGLSLAGMAHDGIDSVPNEGTWLLDKGERVMSSPQADDLDAFLSSQKMNNGGSAPIINVTEAPGQGGMVEPRQNQDGQWVVDIMVEQFGTNGRGSKAAQSAFGLKRQGY